MTFQPSYQKSVLAILNTINLFSSISVYMINWNKSEVMPLSKWCYSSIFFNWKFKWVSKNSKYLGILLNPELENMILDNFSPVSDKIELLFKGWDKLQISLWGRIQAIKMVIAPKLNYLSSIKHTTDHFQCHIMFVQFIWAGKRIRMKTTSLQVYNRDWDFLIWDSGSIYRGSDNISALEQKGQTSMGEFKRRNKGSF